jgi:hypothetical protein
MSLKHLTSHDELSILKSHEVLVQQLRQERRIENVRLDHLKQALCKKLEPKAPSRKPSHAA